MTDKEIIVRQAEKIIELEDKLAEAEETSKYWYKQCAGKEEGKNET